MADDQLLAPPAWDDIEKDNSFTSLDPMQKMATLTKWADYTKGYFQQQGLWDQGDTKQQFHDSVTTKFEEYGNQPVTYDQATRVSREAQDADAKAIAEQPKTPLDLVTGLAGNLKAQEQTKASLAGLGVMSTPGPLAEADFKDIPADKRELYTQKAQQAKAWDEGQIPAFSLEGNVYVQPELALSPDGYAKAVEGTDATPEEKAKALANYPQVQKQTADQILNVLKDTPEFTSFKYDNPVDGYGGDREISQLQDYLQKSKDLGTIENVRATIGQVGLGAKLGWQQTAQSVYGVARAASNLGPQFAQDVAQDVSTDTNNEADKLQQQSELLGGPKPVADITAAAISSGLPLLAGGATGNVAKGLSAARGIQAAEKLAEIGSSAGFGGSVVGSGFQQFGQSYLQAMQDYQKQGKTEDEAAKAAFTPAIATGLSTAIITAVGGKYGVESVFRNEAKDAAKKTILRITKELGVDFGAEAAEEFSDQLVQGIVEKATTNPDKPLKDIVNEAVYAGTLGGLVGAGFGGVHQATEALHSKMTPTEIRPNIEQAAKEVKIETLDKAATNADENYAPQTGATVAKIAEVVANTPAPLASPELTKELDEADETFRKLQEAENGPETPVEGQPAAEESFAPAQEATTPTSPVSENPVTEPKSIVEQANEPDNATRPKEVQGIPESKTAGEIAGQEPEQGVLEQPKLAEASTPEIVDEAKAQAEVPSEQTSPAVEQAEPTAPSVGQKVRLGKQITPFEITEILPQTKAEKADGDQFYSAKNTKTGEVQVVSNRDFTPVKTKTTHNEKTTPKPESAKASPIPNALPVPNGPGRAQRKKAAARQANDLSRRGEQALGKENSAKLDYQKLGALSNEGVSVTFSKEAKTSSTPNSDGTITININPDDFTNTKISKDRIVAVVEEEIVHAAQQIALRKAWQDSGSKEEFQDYVLARSRELRDELFQIRNKLKGKEQKAVDTALIAAHNIYFRSFREDTPAVTNIGEIIDTLNEGDAAVGSGIPNSYAYVMELTRMLYQQREAGRISETTMNSYLKAIADWVRKSYQNFKNALQLFVNEGVLSKTKAAQFLNDIDAVLNGKKPSDKFLAKTDRSAIEQLDGLLSKTDEDDDFAGDAAGVADSFALTPEQQKLVNDNQNLAYSIANQYRNIPKEDYADLKHEAVLALSAAAKNYNPAKGQFGQIASTYINNKLKSLYTKQARRAVRDGGSLNEPTITGDEKVENVPAPTEKAKGDSDAIGKIQKAVQALPERERRILELKAEGLSLREISEELKPDYNLSHEYINQLYKKTAAELQSKLREQGITSREDVFPEQSERTQYLPERVTPEDETRMVEQATEQKLAGEDYTQESKFTSQEEAEDLQVAAKREDDLRLFAKDEDAKHPEYKGEGLWSAAGKWNKEIFKLLQGKEQKVAGALNAIQYLDKGLNTEVKRLEKAGKPVSRETLNTALGNTDNTLTDDQYAAAKQIKDPVARQSFELTAKLANQEEARAAQKEAFDSLPPKLQDIVGEMRENIDNMSHKLVDSGAISGDMAATVGDNLGLYLHRTYSIFDNPEAWKDFIKSDKPEAVRIRNRAETMFRGNAIGQAAYQVFTEARKAGTPITKEEAVEQVKDLDYSAQVQNTLDDYLKIADEGSRSFLGGGLPGQKKKDIITRRGQIPEEIRDLWGEQKDVVSNFAKTYASMAAYLENTNFLNAVLKDGLITATNPDGYIWKEGVSPTTRPVGYQELVTQGSQSMAPLNGVYVPPDLKEAFETYYRGNQSEGFTRLVQAATTLAMTSKTAFSWAGTVRNFLGNMLFMVANGHLQVGKLGGAGKTAWSNFMKKGERERRDYVKKLVELGIVGDNVNPGLIKEIAERARIEQAGDSIIKKGAHGASNEVLSQDNEVLSALWNSGKFVAGKATDLYGTVDDFWKVYAFENELAKLKDALPDASQKDLEQQAADKVRETVPTYSLAYDITRKLRKGPGVFIAPFITFTSEVIRTAIGTIRTGLQETQSDNPKIRAIGYQRLAGFAAAQAIIPAVSLAIKAALGYDDDDENALRQFLPKWQKDAQIVMLKKDEKGNARFIDVSFLNPYSVITEPIYAMLHQVGKGKSADQVASDAVVAGTMRALQPVLSEQIFAGTVADVMRNTTTNGNRVYNPQDTSANIATNIVAHLWSAFEPGTITSLKRIYKAGTGQVGPTGRAYDITAELSSFFAGQRISTYDPKAGLDFSTGPYKRNNQDATMLFSQPFRSRGTVADGAIEQGYKNANAAKMNNAQQLRDFYKAAITLGVAEKDAKRILANAEVGQDTLNEVTKGYYKKYIPDQGTVFTVKKDHPERVVELKKAVADTPDREKLR